MGVCKDCNSSCAENVADSCIVWTGASIPILKIEKGKAYSTNIVNLANELVKVVEATANLKCLFNGCGEVEVDIPTAVQILIDKICEISTDDIINKSSMNCISGGASSAESTYFLGRNSLISTSPTATGGNFVYDATEVTSGLPDEYTISRVNVTVRGNQINGNSLVASSNSPQGIIAIPNQRYPALAEIGITANTPSGIVQLTQTIALVSSATQINSLYEFDIVDYGGAGTTALNLTTAISNMAATICQTKTDVNTLKNIQISDTEFLKFPSKKRDAVVGVIVAELDEVIDDVSKPGNFKVFGKLCSEGCGDTTVEQSLQAVLDGYGQTVCNLVAQVNEMIIRINTLEARVRVCCENSFDSSSNIGGGTGTVISGPCYGSGCS